MVPRSLAQSMPLRWQQVFVGLLADLHDAYGRPARGPSTRWCRAAGSVLVDLDDEQLSAAGLPRRPRRRRAAGVPRRRRRTPVPDPEQHRVLAPVDDPLPPGVGGPRRAAPAPPRCKPPSWVVSGTRSPAAALEPSRQVERGWLKASWMAGPAHGRLESKATQALPTSEATHHGSCGRHRPRDHQLRRRRPRRWRADGHRQLGGRAHHSVGRRVRPQRRGARRAVGEEPGRHQRRPDDPVGQAAHRHRLGDARHRRQEVLGAGDQRPGAAEAQARRRVLPGRGDHRRGDHRARLLRGRAAPGHQGGRPDRGPQRAAHRQRAHRGRAGLRARQGREGADHPGLRPRWRHVRRLAAGDRRGRRRGQGHQRRQPPRWRRLGRAGHHLARRQVQEPPGHRPDQGQDGHAAAARGRGEGEDRAVEPELRPRSTCPTSPSTPTRTRCSSTRRCRAPSSSGSPPTCSTAPARRSTR